MENKLNYTEAYQKLQGLVEQLEDGDIPLEELTDKVKAANELIVICEDKLRNIEEELNATLNTEA